MEYSAGPDGADHDVWPGVVPAAAKRLPIEVMKAFSGVDLILHAGDIYSLSVLDDLVLTSIS